MIRFTCGYRVIFVVVTVGSGLAVACNAEVTPVTGPSSPPRSESPTETSPTETQPSKPSEPAFDGGVDADANPHEATLSINDGTFTNSKGTTKFIYRIMFTLQNTSSEAVVSLETMTLDFGSGKDVVLNQPACSGNFPIGAGASKTVDIGVVAESDGTVYPAGFSIICPNGSQRFGEGAGTAPATDTLTTPITIKIEGKTGKSAFVASGIATRGS